MRFIIILYFTFFSLISFSQEKSVKNPDISQDVSNPFDLIKSESHRCKYKGECGWWFGFIDKNEMAEDKDESEQEDLTSAPSSNESKEEKCSNPDKWTDDCGWVDPKGDFEFLVMMREKLSQNALMYSDNQKHVKEFQKFMLWLVDSAISYSKTWEWNMIQDQSLNPFARHPVSTFGLRAAVRTTDKHVLGIFDEIKNQGGSLVFFSRFDCSFCHTQSPVIEKLSLETSIPVVNVSLDKNCMPQFSGEQCITADADYIQEAVTAIGVNIVPDLFLFLPKDNQDNNGWVRVSTGNESVATIKRRIRMFFEGVRSASIAGLSEAANSFKDQKRPNATFGTKHNSKYVPGTTFIDNQGQGR